ncbi:adenomatous polyposis coli protein [Trichonephila clavipes]|nr:adenomatous polyposis coli protein [Trichonephila clavipes]
MEHHSSVSSMSFQSTLSDSIQSDQSREEEIISQLNEARNCNREEASKRLLAMTQVNGNCAVLRHCGCLPLLIELLHDGVGGSSEVRKNATQVLHNLVFSQPDDKRARREGRVLRYLEEIREYSDKLLYVEANVDNRTGCGSPVVKVSDHGRHIMNSSPGPLKTRAREICRELKRPPVGGV